MRVVVAYARAEMYANVSASAPTLAQLVAGVGSGGHSDHNPSLIALLGHEEGSLLDLPGYGAEKDAEKSLLLGQAARQAVEKGRFAARARWARAKTKTARAGYSGLPKKAPKQP
jgi:hypothetical protein